MFTISMDLDGQFFRVLIACRMRKNLPEASYGRFFLNTIIIFSFSLKQKDSNQIYSGKNTLFSEIF
jgi:hypothetical protein